MTCRFLAFASRRHRSEQRGSLPSPGAQSNNEFWTVASVPISNNQVAVGVGFQMNFSASLALAPLAPERWPRSSLETSSSPPRTDYIEGKNSQNLTIPMTHPVLARTNDTVVRGSPTSPLRPFRFAPFGLDAIAAVYPPVSPCGRTRWAGRSPSSCRRTSRRWPTSRRRLRSPSSRRTTSRSPSRASRASPPPSSSSRWRATSVRYVFDRGVAWRG